MIEIFFIQTEKSITKSNLTSNAVNLYKIKYSVSNTT